MTDTDRDAARRRIARRNRAWQRADEALGNALRDAGIRVDPNTVDRITSGLLERGHEVKAVRS